jgi:hypothetical protein
LNGTGLQHSYVRIHSRGAHNQLFNPTAQSSSQVQIKVAFSFPSPETAWVQLCNYFGSCAPKWQYLEFSPAHTIAGWTRMDTSFGTQPERQVPAELNYDGIFDIVSVDSASNQVLVFFGNGNGTFQSPITHSTGANPSNLVVAPFLWNVDAPDVATTNYSDNTVSVILHDNNASSYAFLPSEIDSPVGKGPVALAAADFNGDSMMDLAVVNSLDDTVSILLGNGDGTFQPQLTFATGSNPADIAVGDFNRDGKLDLAIANFGSFSGHTVSILLGNGTGAFGKRTDYNTDGGTQSVIAVDLNFDGILDLVTANGCGHASVCGNPGTVSVLLGNGNGTFGAAKNYNAGSYPFTVIAADFRANGMLDLAVSDLDSGAITVLPETSKTATFGNPITILTNGRPVGLATADFNNDGKLDLVVGGDNPAGFTLMLQQ